jgi:hypothetical protein
MNGLVDYTRRAQTIREVLAFRAEHPDLEDYVLDAKLDMLGRIEGTLAESLHRGGMSQEAAQQSALSFVSQTVAYYRGNGV